MDKSEMTSVSDKIAMIRKRGEEFGRTPEGRALDNRLLVSRNIIGLLNAGTSLL